MQTRILVPSPYKSINLNHMSVLVFVPALICLLLVVRGYLETAFLYVYLPALLLLPASYATRVPHLPPLSISMATVIPLGIAALIQFALKGRLSLMDLLVVSFMMSLTISEVEKEHIQNDGIFSAISAFIEMFLPYAVGRTMIEPDLRLPTVRQIVVLVLFLGLPGIYSWRMEVNPYASAGNILFGVDMSSAVQVRSGRGRMAAAFTDAEIAGAAFGMVASLNAWLAYLRKQGLGASLGARMDWLQKFHIPGLLLLLYVLMTQSRGPMAGLAVAYCVLQIPRFKNTRRATAVVAMLLVLGAVGVKQYLSRYTNITDPYAILDEQQSSAVYRRTMTEVFKPVVEKGDWLGWGSNSIPKVEGLFEIRPGVQSIDDEFLFVHVAYGRLGYILFVLIAAETVRTLIVRTWFIDPLEDRVFVFSMLSAIAILWITLATVEMGEQMPQVAFLFIGWCQSIPLVRAPAPPPKFLFKRIFE